MLSFYVGLRFGFWLVVAWGEDVGILSYVRWVLCCSFCFCGFYIFILSYCVFYYDGSCTVFWGKGWMKWVYVMFVFVCFFVVVFG